MPNQHFYDSDSDDADGFIKDALKNRDEDYSTSIKKRTRKEESEPVRRLKNFRTKQRKNHLRPEQMSRTHAELERQINPLIELLSVNIEIVESDLDNDTDGSADEFGSQDEITPKPKPNLSNEATPSNDARPPVHKAPKIKSENILILDEEPEKSLSLSTSTSKSASASASEPEPTPAPEQDDDATDSNDGGKIDWDAQDDDDDDFFLNEFERGKPKPPPVPTPETPLPQLEQSKEADTPVIQNEHVSIWDETEDNETIELMNSYPKKQTDALPNLEVKDYMQDLIGPLELGVDKNGNKVILPACMNKFLREYQRDGVRFFVKHFLNNEGGILGDDMGLGKTIQVVCFLAAIMNLSGTKKDRNRRKGLNPSKDSPTALVLAPSSVVYNWERELHTWGYFNVAVCDSGKNELKKIMSAFKNGYYDIVISSHEFARRNMDLFERAKFDVVVVDECHKIKDPRSQLTVAFHKLPTRIRFGLTGTAMQNRYSEFWTILDWAFPGKIGSQADWELFVTKPLQAAQKQNASDLELAIGRTRASAFVSVFLPRFFLRRTKDLIKDQLPEKKDRVVFCPMTPEQRAAYGNLLETNAVKRILDAKKPCPCGRKDKEGKHYQTGKCCDPTWNDLIFTCISLFQKVSNHLCLIYPNEQDKVQNAEKYNQDKHWIKLAFPDDYHSRKMGFKAEIDQNLCGKWKVLRDLLAQWKNNNDKVLLFSRSMKILDALEHWFQKDGYIYSRLDGRINTTKRLQLCDNFNDNPKQFVFLISTTAGGVGLNLTSANRVVIFDPNWNPTYDMQAMDRSYRWGQTRDVNVYRLVGAGSLEELIYRRQIYKQQASNIAYTAAHERRYFSGVQDDQNQQGELFGVQNLFRFQNEEFMLESSIEDCDVESLGDQISNVVGNKQSKNAEKNNIGENEQTENSNELFKLVESGGLSATNNKATNSNQDEVDRILSDVKTHFHSRLIGTSTEEERKSMKAFMENREALKRMSQRYAASSKNTGTTKATLVWPPIRKSK